MKLSLVLKKADINFQDTLNPEGFFFTMNSYLDLMLLSIIPKIKDAERFSNENAKILKRNKLSFIEDYTDIMIDLFISDTAKLFATDFLEIVLKSGKNLDVDALTRELTSRIKKQSEAWH